MKIAFIDVDDVLLNFQDAFIEALNKEFGKEIPLGSRPSEWDWSCWLSKEEMEIIQSPLDWFHRVRPKWNVNQKVMDPLFTTLFMDQLRTQKVHVVLLTAIPLEFSLGRIQNLRTEGIRYDEIYFTDGFKKSDFIHQLVSKYVSMDGKIPSKLAFLDDRGKTCIDVAVNCPFIEVRSSLLYPKMKVLSLDTPYNTKEMELEKHSGLKIAWCLDVAEMYNETINYFTED